MKKVSDKKQEAFYIKRINDLKVLETKLKNNLKNVSSEDKFEIKRRIQKIKQRIKSTKHDLKLLKNNQRLR